MKSVSEYIVSESDIDEFGHLNHVFALKFLEHARDVWYEEAGLWGGRPWSDSEVLGTIVLNLNVNYRLECFEGEKLTVKTWPGKAGTKSYTLSQSLHKPGGEIAIDAVCTSLIMDLSTKKTLSVPDSIRVYL